MVKYEDIMVVIRTNHPETCIRETGNHEGRIIVVKDNGDIWFYFGTDGFLKDIRVY